MHGAGKTRRYAVAKILLALGIAFAFTSVASFFWVAENVLGRRGLVPLASLLMIVSFSLAVASLVAGLVSGVAERYRRRIPESFND